MFNSEEIQVPRENSYSKMNHVSENIRTPPHCLGLFFPQSPWSSPGTANEMESVRGLKANSFAATDFVTIWPGWSIANIISQVSSDVLIKAFRSFAGVSSDCRDKRNCITLEGMHQCTGGICLTLEWPYNCTRCQKKLHKVPKNCTRCQKKLHKVPSRWRFICHWSHLEAGHSSRCSVYVLVKLFYVLSSFSLCSD